MRFPEWVPTLVNNVARRVGFDVARFHPEVHVLARRMRLLREQHIDLVFDIGANLGQYAGNLRDLGYRGRIVSFEPLAAVFAELSERIQKDRQWTAVHCGVGDQKGKATIHVAGNTQSSSLLPMLQTHVNSAPDSAIVGDEQIDVETLRDLIGAHTRATERLFVKIDAQGYEQRIVASGGAALDRVLGFQLEMSLVPLYQGEKLLAEMIQDMQARGFALMSIEPGFSDPATGRLLQADGVFFRGY